MKVSNRKAKSVFFLVLDFAGLISAWALNGFASATGQDYLSAWFGSAADWVLSADLVLVAIAGSAFMIFESRKLGMRRVWLYIALSGITAFAFTFPLFLHMRERKLMEIEASPKR